MAFRHTLRGAGLVRPTALAPRSLCPRPARRTHELFEKLRRFVSPNTRSDVRWMARLISAVQRCGTTSRRLRQTVTHDVRPWLPLWSPLKPTTIRTVCRWPHQYSRRYSLRSAVIGSTRMARRVGARPAINATRNSTPDTAASVAGSVGVTSKSDF